ncbi:hypothetical protein CN645_26860 [Burkholderia sp. IDO3]|nr:hypothetical protein DCN14_29450 [Burkholderia sp. IDO3]PCD58673.1 hypothetical protein CN645_26860 [Burkholderia sp. IDO3]
MSFLNAAIDPTLPRRGGSLTGALAERNCHQALDILSGLFNYLVTAVYLAGNPAHHLTPTAVYMIAIRGATHDHVDSRSSGWSPGIALLARPG